MSTNGEKRKSYSHESLVKALACVKNGKMNVTDAAKVFEIPRQTLKDKVSNKYKRDIRGQPTRLTTDEETYIVRYIDFMAKRGHPLSISHIKDFAWFIAKESNRTSKFREDVGPTDSWWRGFKRRHSNCITLHKPDNKTKEKKLKVMTKSPTVTSEKLSNMIKDTNKLLKKKAKEKQERVKEKKKKTEVADSKKDTKSTYSHELVVDEESDSKTSISSSSEDEVDSFSSPSDDNSDA
ncbi:uncharacterized protein LOC130657643 [Hydractinia symbiolongicarpus]|uniref:uncharacterized protein LOC130657643 n=1 Tax=Hydractinia symbiolongicarpus TaxID=13093 RepID=UPI0025503DCD|nr:uncharacterized protein LOC130657643 [Hydractinia symbiolongicarpus]